MLNKNYTIVWEKWVDPYGTNLESVEWPGYDNENIIEDEEEDFHKKPSINKFNALVTNMGVIPFNEYTDCTKIFNFWTGHTNFDLTKRVASLLQSIDGVETLDIFTRYRFRISFGKAFDERQVIDSINQTIKTLST